MSVIILMTLFWFSVALVLFTFALFPAIVLLRGFVVRRGCKTGDITPHVSVIVAAHNEEKNIGARIENLLSMDYPVDRIEILIASDGSTDRTDEIAAGYAEQRVQLLSFPRGGKITTLNRAVETASGEILVFTDANSIFNPDTVRALVRPFADAEVGGVAGNQVYSKQESASLTADGECAYWNFDRAMKFAQSRSGSVTSATGGIYAIRRELFRPIPLGVTDDFVASTAVIAEGYRLVFADDAVCTEPVATEAKTEFGRKVRVLTQGLLAVIVMRRLFNPFRHGFYALQLFWHKVLRRLMVFPLLVILATSFALWGEGDFYKMASLIQAALYVCALSGWVLRGTKVGRWRVLTIPFYFCMVNAAALLAVFKLLRGQRIELWEPQRTSQVLQTATSASSSTSGRSAV